MEYYAIVVASKNNRPKRYRYLAYDKDDAYRKYCRENEPNIKYLGAQNKIMSIQPITEKEWNESVERYSVNTF